MPRFICITELWYT